MSTRTLLATLAALASLGLLAGCAGARPRPVPAGAALLATHGDGRVGTYVSGPDSFSTSSYWIEGPSGLVLIDTQFLLSAAEEFVDWAERLTGKKAVLAIILHPNPDKFNGTEELKRRGIRVVTSEQIAKLIPEIHKDRHYWFYDRYKPDYPDLAPTPESFGARTRELEAAGLKLRVHVLGPGCSEAHVVVEYDGHVFTGDLVASLHHSWLEIGKTDEWLRRLAEIRALHPEFVHPGRGPNGGPELLDRQERYLKRVIELVAREKPRGEPDDERLARVKAILEREYAGYGNAYFLEIGLPAEWERQAKILQEMSL